MTDIATIIWQDVIVWAALLLAVTYLVRKLILPRLRHEPTGCAKCGAYQAITQKRGATVKKLSETESKKFRSELRKNG